MIIYDHDEDQAHLINKNQKMQYKTAKNSYSFFTELFDSEDRMKTANLAR